MEGPTKLRGGEEVTYYFSKWDMKWIANAYVRKFGATQRCGGSGYTQLDAYRNLQRYVDLGF